MNTVKLKKFVAYPILQTLKYLYGMVPLSCRYGKVFRETYKFLCESQWWSREKLEVYQMQQLGKLLSHAYENVPYYRKIFDERALKPKDINRLEDLKKLPYLTKDIIRNNLDDLVSKNFPKNKLKTQNTSGTTGTKLKYYVQDYGIVDPIEAAFVWRQWGWVGVKYHEKRIVLRGELFPATKKGNKKLFKYNPVDNELILSSYMMTRENLSLYIELIRKFSPSIVQGYPSSLYILSVFINSNRIKLNDIKCVLTSSETLFHDHLVEIEKAFNAKIYDLYGQNEKCAMIVQCERFHYHTVPEYGVVELEENRMIDNKKYNEIIGTGFNNFAFPFIRYRTQDFVDLNSEMCSCKRNFPIVKKIIGRLHDFLVTREGNYIPLIGNTDGLKWDVSEKVEKAQLYQEKAGLLILTIVKKPGYSDKDSDIILSTLKQRYGEDFTYRIEFVKDIPRTDSGKFKFLIQKVPVVF